MFIDLFRFVAALLMVQGHVFDALLSPQVKAHHLFQVHNFFHGFVAPAFLFASGMTYGISTIPKWDEYIIWGSRARHRFCKFLGLMALGYALHLPYLSLRKLITSASPAARTSFLQADVLQCVGVTLLLLQVGIFIIKDRRAFKSFVTAIAIVIIFFAPVTWSAHLVGYLPEALVSYITPETSSWFPLFPWAAYILCGVLFGFVLSKRRDPKQVASIIWKYAALSAGALLVAWRVMYVPFNFYPAHDFWKANPAMFFVRLSVVSIVACFVFLAENWQGIATRIASMVGKQSLFVYVVHLVVVYRSVLNRGLAQRIGQTLPVFPALGVCIAVLIGIIVIAVLWHNFKMQHEMAASRVTTAGAAIFLFEFVRRPW